VSFNASSGRPISSHFYNFLPNFLSENPSIKCPGAGRAAYGAAIRMTPKGNSSYTVYASHYMTLRSLRDYILTT